MKKLKKAAISALSVAVAMSCLWLMPSSADGVDNATIKSYEDQIAESRAKQKELETQLAGLSSQLEDALAVKANIDSNIEVTAQQRIILETMISEVEAHIESLKVQEEETLAKIDEQREAFLKRMAAQQEDDNASYVALVLGAEDMTTFLSNYDYVTSILEYDKQVISSLKESKQLLEATRAEQEASLETHKVALAELESQQEYYSQLLEKQEAIINTINNDTALKESMLSTFKSEEEKLDVNLKEMLLEVERQQELLAQQQQNQNQNEQSTDEEAPSTSITVPNVYAEGDFIWPLQTGTISSNFGGRYLNGSYDYHAATDIACATGTPIYSSNSGTVLKSEWHDSYGNYVLVDHGNGISTLYAHMSVRTCTAGQAVSRGQKIGEVGNTGYSFGSHLHFEYRIHGDRVDAELYVKR